MDIWIIVYVDDLIIATKTIEAQQFVKQFLLTQFKMKEIGLPTMFLGMNLEHHPETKSTILHQNMYINKVISDFAQHLKKITAVTPMQGRAKLRTKSN